MRTQLGILFSVVLVSLSITGCGTTPTNTANTAANTNQTANTAKPGDEAKNNAPTLTPVYKAYCDAKVKNDEAALRKVYSKDTIKYFEDEMKADNVKSLLKFLEDDVVTGKLCEVRNEEITGDTAVAEIRSDSYPNGIKVVFVKEDGEWKMTNKSPNPNSITNTKPEAAPANPENDKKAETKKEGK